MEIGAAGFPLVDVGGAGVLWVCWAETSLAGVVMAMMTRAQIIFA
jgi:hypothetical protein